MSKVSNRGLNQLGPPPRVMQFDGIRQHQTPGTLRKKKWTKADLERVIAYHKRMEQFYTRLPKKTIEQHELTLAMSLDRGRAPKRKQPSMPKLNIPDVGKD